MATKDTGIMMDVEDEVTQENGTDAAIEVAAAEMTRGAQVADQGPSDPVAADAAASSHAPSESAAVEANAVSGTDAATSAEELKEPKKETLTYTQEDIDLLKAKHERDQQFKDNRLREVENELKEKKEKIQSIHERTRDRDNRMDSMFSLVGDGSPAKIYELIKKAVEFQLEADKAKKLQKDYDELLKAKKTIENWYTETNQKYLALRTDHESAKKDLEQKTKDLAEVNSAYSELYVQCEACERMLNSSVPQCLVSKDWFDAFFRGIKAELQEDPIFDPAMLVLASLAELAVMERNSAVPCFEWKKQLADIGLVVANYMHQKKTAEGDVLKMLRNFSQALQEMPILKKLKIVFKVPSLGSDFNTDEVKHKNNGSSIAKVINWCIVEDGHVYCKAIVE